MLRHYRRLAGMPIDYARQRFFEIRNILIFRAEIFAAPITGFSLFQEILISSDD